MHLVYGEYGREPQSNGQWPGKIQIRDRAVLKPQCVRGPRMPNLEFQVPACEECGVTNEIKWLGTAKIEDRKAHGPQCTRGLIGRALVSISSQKKIDGMEYSLHDRALKVPQCYPNMDERLNQP